MQCSTSHDNSQQTQQTKPTPPPQCAQCDGAPSPLLTPTIRPLPDSSDALRSSPGHTLGGAFASGTRSTTTSPTSAPEHNVSGADTGSIIDTPVFDTFAHQISNDPFLNSRINSNSMPDHTLGGASSTKGPSATSTHARDEIGDARQLSVRVAALEDALATARAAIAKPQGLAKDAATAAAILATASQQVLPPPPLFTSSTNRSGVILSVENLAADIDDEKLREIFEPFGTVSWAMVHTNDKGMSRSYGHIFFNSQEAATKAVSEMNGRILGNQPLHVRLLPCTKSQASSAELEGTKKETRTAHEPEITATSTKTVDALNLGAPHNTDPSPMLSLPSTQRGTLANRGASSADTDTPSLLSASSLAWPNKTGLAEYLVDTTTNEVISYVAAEVHNLIMEKPRASNSFAEEDDLPYNIQQIQAEQMGAEAPSGDFVEVERTITHTLNSVCKRVHFSPAYLITALMYLETMSMRNKTINLTTTWQPMLIAAIFITQKVFGDRSIYNFDFSKICPKLSFKEITLYKEKLLEILKHDVSISKTIYKSHCLRVRTRSLLALMSTRQPLSLIKTNEANEHKSTKQANKPHVDDAEKPSLISSQIGTLGPYGVSAGTGNNNAELEEPSMFNTEVSTDGNAELETPSMLSAEISTDGNAEIETPSMFNAELLTDSKQVNSRQRIACWNDDPNAPGATTSPSILSAQNIMLGHRCCSLDTSVANADSLGGDINESVADTDKSSPPSQSRGMLGHHDASLDTSNANADPRGGDITASVENPTLPMLSLQRGTPGDSIASPDITQDVCATAAVAIQSTWRACLTRWRFADTLYLIILVQSTWRGASVRQKRATSDARSPDTRSPSSDAESSTSHGDSVRVTDDEDPVAFEAMQLARCERPSGRETPSPSTLAQQTRHEQRDRKRSIQRHRAAARRLKFSGDAFDDDPDAYVRRAESGDDDSCDSGPHDANAAIMHDATGSSSAEHKPSFYTSPASPDSHMPTELPPMPPPPSRELCELDGTIYPPEPTSPPSTTHDKQGIFCGGCLIDADAERVLSSSVADDPNQPAMVGTSAGDDGGLARLLSASQVDALLRPYAFSDDELHALALPRPATHETPSLSPAELPPRPPTREAGTATSPLYESDATDDAPTPSPLTPRLPPSIVETIVLQPGDGSDDRPPSRVVINASTPTSAPPLGSVSHPQHGDDSISRTHAPGGHSTMSCKAVEFRPIAQSAAYDVERRFDTDGLLYTMTEFTEYYGGTCEWEQAGCLHDAYSQPPLLAPHTWQREPHHSLPRDAEHLLTLLEAPQYSSAKQQEEPSRPPPTSPSRRNAAARARRVARKRWHAASIP